MKEELQMDGVQIVYLIMKMKSVIGILMLISFFYLKKIFNELNVSKINDKINEKFSISNFGIENPINLDERDNYFLKNFTNNYNYFLKENFEIGKARLAIKNSSTEDSCRLTSRCLWGCPQNAIYNPLYSTLKNVRLIIILNILIIVKYLILI